MRVVDVEKFVKEARKANGESFLKTLDELTYNSLTEKDYMSMVAFRRGVETILEMLETSDDIFEVNKIAKDIIHKRGCDDDENLYCDDCEHQRSVQWCARAIKDRKDIDPIYEEGWMDGVEAAKKSLNGYDGGYADGWDDGWKECLESIRIAMKKVLEDNK